MNSETKPIPTLAKSAFRMAQSDFQQAVNNLGVQTLEVMGLPIEEGWQVDFNQGVALRTTEDGAKRVAQ